MALVLLPGLQTLIEDISDEKKTAHPVGGSGVREALLKATSAIAARSISAFSEDPFEEDYFRHLTSVLDLEEEGYRVLASEDRYRAIGRWRATYSRRSGARRGFSKVAETPRSATTVVLEVTPEKKIFGRMAASATSRCWPRNARQASAAYQEEFADLEDRCSTSRVIRFERTSWIMAVSSAWGRPGWG